MIESLYIHIPFCERKCHYCDFNSYALEGQPVMEYLKAMNKEMQLITEQYPATKLKTIFIGGGTPTVLEPKEMEFMLKSVIKNFPSWADDIEFTVEVNPGTVNSDKLQVMLDNGVNRLSMGVQAFQNDLLASIGRIHTESDVYHSIDNALKVGFNNLSIDLMLGLPKQTLSMLKESLSKALNLGLPHFSVYSLKVEENTYFFKLYEENKLPLPSEDTELEMYLSTIEEMQKHGYNQYEISNFSKKGNESKHNINYWKNKGYYGIGAGAHGYIDNQRYENVKGVKPYIEKIEKNNDLPIIDKFTVTLEEQMQDTMMLGLRMLEGVSFSEFKARFSVDMEQVYAKEIDKLLKAELIVREKGGIRLSSKGLIYGNEVFAEFIS